MIIPQHSISAFFFYGNTKFQIHKKLNERSLYFIAWESRFIQSELVRVFSEHKLEVGEPKSLSNVEGLEIPSRDGDSRTI